MYLEATHLANSQRLNDAPLLRARMASAHAAAEPEWDPPEQLEELIYEGFPSPSDKRLMEAFQDLDWEQRRELASQFQDAWFQSLARRWIYVGAPGLLGDAEKKSIEQAIVERLHSDHDNPKKWRTISRARAELDKMMKRHPENKLQDPINQYLDQLAARFDPDVSV